MRDIDIRRALRVEIKRLHSGEPDTLIVEELGLCQGIARVDLAVVNGSVHGYEIKSEQDTLARLPNQKDIYNRALDFVTIVAAPAHVHGVDKVVPPWWGVWIVIEDRDKGVLRLERSRKPRRNPGIDPFALAQLLWRDEALQALTDHGLATGLRSKPREELWRRLASDVKVEELGDIVRERLKRRGGDWRSLAPLA
jgi:hypothetical protein